MPPLLKTFDKMSPSKAQPDDKRPSNLDIIFACSVCNATLSEVYKDHTESMKGLDDGINKRHRLVTRLYVTSCCHVICIKHIGDGNGPTFPPNGERPRAPCPVCIEENGQNQPRDLFSIRGFKAGECDPGIPKAWFSVPPTKLDGSGKETEALRFQYLSLTRFGRKVSTAITDLEKSKKKLEDTVDYFQQQHKEVLSRGEENLRLVSQVSRLRQVEKELSSRKARDPAIQYYLGIIPKLVEQNRFMQDQLAQLDFPLTLEPIPSYTGPFPLDDEDSRGDVEQYAGQQQAHASHAVDPSVRNKGYDNVEDESSSPQTSPPYKRARIDAPSRSKNVYAGPPSRDLMPPPSKPISRMASVRNLFSTTVRQRFSSKGKEKAQQILETPLPDPGSASRGGLQATGTEFTFRSESPVKLDKLPTQPSYIHLMDSIDRDTGLNLELQDPRDHASDQTYRDSQAGPSGQYKHGKGPSQKHYTSQNASFAQSPRKRLSASLGFGGYNPLRSHPTGASVAEAHVDPVTPGPSRSRPTEEVENAVSPFFGSRNRNSLQFSRASVAERQDREIGSNGYPSHRHLELKPEPLMQRNWHEAPSLNGLSFFDSPLNKSNEAIEWRRGENGLYRTNSSHWNPFERAPSYQPHVQSSSAISFQRSPLNTNSHLVGLERTGVRSSRALHTSVPVRTFATPTRNLFTGSGRRTVRR